MESKITLLFDYMCGSMLNTNIFCLYVAHLRDVMKLWIQRTSTKPACLIAAEFLIAIWNVQVFRPMQQPVQTKGPVLSGESIPMAHVVSASI